MRALIRLPVGCVGIFGEMQVPRNVQLVNCGTALEYVGGEYWECAVGCWRGESGLRELKGVRAICFEED